MPSSIQNLNALIPAKSILQALNERVKTTVAGFPHPAVCPFCNDSGKSLRVFLDPQEDSLSDQGPWVYCRSCGYASDGVGFFQRLRETKGLVRLMGILQSEGLVSLPGSVLDPDTISYYQRMHEINRVRPIALWENSRHEYDKGVQPEWVELLMDKGLWSGTSTRAWKGRMDNYIGMLSQEGILNHIPNASLSPKGMRHALVIPYYDLPGRIRSFIFASKHHEIRYIIDGYDPEAVDSGLAWINDLGDQERVVYAINDPWLGLKLQRKHFHALAKPLPLVIYNRLTAEGSWSSIRAQKVILWEPKPTVDTFIQARMVANSCISMKPRPTTRTMEEMLGQMAPMDILNKMNRYSSPWERVFKSWFLSIPENDCPTVLTQMNLTAGETEKILYDCARHDLREMKLRLGHVDEVKRTSWSTMEVRAEPSGWYITRRGKKSYQVTDFHMEIRKTVHHRPTGKHYVVGIIQSQGKPDLTFTAEHDDFEKDPGRWLTRFMMDKGRPKPFILRGWEKKLMNIAQRFHTPTSESSDGRIGWQKDGSFTFPSFSYQHGKIIQGRSVFLIQPEKDLPFRNIYLPQLTLNSNVVNSWISNAKASSTFLATSATILSNMLAPVFDTPFIPIGLVGTENDTGVYIGNKIVDSMNLVKLGQNVLTSRSKAAIHDSLIEKASAHDIPCYFDKDVLGGKGLSLWANSVTRPIIAKLGILEQYAVSACGTWLFIHSPGITQQAGNILNMPAMLRYIGWLQERDYKIEMGGIFPFDVLHSMRKWLEHEFKGVAFREVFEEAETIMKYLSIAPEMYSVGERMMLLLCELYRRNEIKKINKAFYNAYKHGSLPELRNATILVDTEHQLLYISRKKLLHTLQKLGLPHPSFSDVAQSLIKSKALVEDIEDADNGSGWVIKRSFFERVSSAWKNVTI